MEHKNNWSRISSQATKNILIQEYIKRKLEAEETPLVSEGKSYENIIKAISRGKLTDEDFVMKGSDLIDIDGVLFSGTQLIIASNKKSAPN